MIPRVICSLVNIAIIKQLERGNASQSLFVHPGSSGSHSVIICDHAVETIALPKKPRKDDTAPPIASAMKTATPSPLPEGSIPLGNQ